MKSVSNNAASEFSFLWFHWFLHFEAVRIIHQWDLCASSTLDLQCIAAIMWENKADFYSGVFKKSSTANTLWDMKHCWLFYWLQDTPRPLFHPVKKHFDVIMSSHLAAHKGLLTFDFIFCDSCWLWGWTESMLFDVPLLLTGSCMMHIPCLFFQFSNFSDRNNFELKIEFIHTFILFVCFFYSHFTFSVIEIETLWYPPRDIWSMFGWRWAGVLLYRASPNQAFEAFKLCHPACDSGIHWNTNYLLLLPHQKSTACLCVAYST